MKEETVGLCSWRYHFYFQFASLYNLVDRRVREWIQKMLMLGVTQRSEMRRHINIFVQEHFPDVSEMDASFYLGDQALSLIMYCSMLLHQHTHIDQDWVLSLVRLS